MNRFEGKVVVVTGAASGIGEASARRFIDEGASVVLADRDQENLGRVEQSLPGDRILAHTSDVSSRTACDAVIAAAVERFGRIDVVVANAGINRTGTLTETTDELWREVLSTDLDSVFYLSRAAVPHLTATKGALVAVASVSAVGGGWSHAAYSAAKAGVANLMRAAALDLGPDGVRANAVCPGLTDTPMVAPILGNEAVMTKGYDRIALRRVAQPHEIAAAIAFLASEDASFITGTALTVDGGQTATDGGPKWL
jgi:meso-butanediol dehydrogenase/(S,S)-butanediol dehydrogenase/diacetyl reductase